MPINGSLLRGVLILASSALVLWLLSWLKPVLLPIALAILMTFLLKPLVMLLQRGRVPRHIAVGLIVMAAGAAMWGVGSLVERQISGLLDTFPQYEDNLKAKLSTLKDGQLGVLDNVRSTIERVMEQQAKSSPKSAGLPDPPGKTGPLPLQVVPNEGPFRLSTLGAILGPIVEPVATIGLAVVLLFFMLIRREDLRDRIISLVGHGRLTLTTKVLDEAGERISRYLLSQFVLNLSYGLCVSAGLFLIGIPYAFL
jgi:predicted PurR-regulated permease PerM